MMKRWKRLYYSVLILICFMVVSDAVKAADLSATNKKYSQIIAFGDSYSDNGNAKKISTEIVYEHPEVKEAIIKPQDELYWKNRYSNGNTAVEVLAAKLQISIKNYAVGGATSGWTNYSSWMDTLYPTGVLGQIDQFEKSLSKKKADKDALYFIFVSANDYFVYVDYNRTGKVEAVADEAIDHIKTAVRRLSRLGAKKFLIVNSSDLTMAPFEILMERTATAAKFTSFINSNLPNEIRLLESLFNVNIQLFDLKKATDEIQSSKNEYSFESYTEPCQITYPIPLLAKEKPDTYFFWDEWHYSKDAHNVIGNKMYNFVIKNSLT